MRHTTTKGTKMSRSLALAVALIGVLAFTAAPASAATTFAGPGEGAGQVAAPLGVAVDQFSGTVYVADQNGARIAKFDSAGNFLLAFGFGVLNGAEALQVCTTTCGAGRAGPAPGEILPVAVAVDNSAGPSSGDLYVTDFGQHRVEKFSPAGELLLMFGKEVNKTKVKEGKSPAEQNLCTKADLQARDTCGGGVPGTGPGEFSEVTSGSGATMPIAVDASGDVRVGDINRLETFSPEGAFLSEVKLPGAGPVRALAVDSFSGDFYVIADNLAGLQKLEPSGAPFGSPFPLDASGHPGGLGLDPATGDLFVSDDPGTVGTSPTLLEYSPSGTELEVFGAGQVIGEPQRNALAFGDSADALYVVSSKSGDESAAQAVPLPPPGPLLREASLSAKPFKTTTATLNATLNPEGAETKYHFQYVSDQHFKAEGFNHPSESAVASLPADFAEHPVADSITGLQAETIYHFRVLAENVNGKGNVTGSEEATFTTLPPAQIDAQFVSDVTATSATLGAQINPLGNATEYRFEYLTEAAYQENVNNGLEPFTGAALIPTSDAQIGNGEEDQGVSQHLSGLLSSTTYRYRVLAHNIGGIAKGSAEAFTTQGSAAGALLDGRQWELVSPPDKHGAGILQIDSQSQLAIQASADGGALTYLATAPTEAEPAGNSNYTQVLSTRGSGGWESHDIALPHSQATGLAAVPEYRFFSNDLSLGLVQPYGVFDPSISADASEQTAYLRTDYPAGDSADPCASSCYRPLVTGVLDQENVPPGTEFGVNALFGGKCPAEPLCGPELVGATPDFGYVLLRSHVGLTSTPQDEGGLYEWSGGHLTLVSVLPGGAPAGPKSEPGLGQPNPGAGEDYIHPFVVRNAISADGSRVVWSEGFGSHHLYLRDVAAEETVGLDVVQPGASGIGSVNPLFQAASSDGSRVFFTDTQRLTSGSGASANEPDLYQCEVVEEGGEPKCDLTDLTPESSGRNADLLRTVIGASEDGSSLYFVANGVLTGAPNAQGQSATLGNCFSEGINSGGSCSLYRWHDGAIAFVATLSAEDVHDWGAGVVGEPPLSVLTARVSPDGRYLAFMSQRSLTGYDNRDALSGQPDQEVYLYDASGNGGTGTLACASCSPTGARPHVGANLPAWTSGLYQSRYLSNDGRLFFNSSDALVPQDTNGIQDVYEYEPPGVGDCIGTSATFSRASGGCVGPISPGASPEESAFLDASENGDEVFFLTNARLSPRDVDSSIDVYDAHVCSASSACPPSPPSPPPACVGDACQNPGEAPNDPTPGSLTYHGPGNPTLLAAAPVVKPKAKSLTRAQKLAQALRACRKKPSKKRAACNAQAKKKYGSAKAKKSATANRRNK